MNKESIRVITCAAFNRSLNAEQLSEGVVDFINPTPHRPNTEKKTHPYASTTRTDFSFCDFVFVQIY